MYHFIGRTLGGLVLLLALIVECSAGQLSDAVVKVFVTSNSMDYYRPWQAQGISSSVGSGSVIVGNRILTNAHVVADQTFIQVKKENDPKKYTAKVVGIGHDCDLALLSVEETSFFEGVKPIALGGLPKLQDAVTVLGYPRGGDKISVTKGVVSRVELTPYAQSGRKLLTVQIDAAINPGNSGGPVVLEDKLVGVAMQALKSGQNIGYMIPMPVVRHFLEDFEDGKYDHFPILGVDFETTENEALRELYQIDHLEGGVVISRVLPYSAADGFLKEADVILAIDGVAIGEDGTFKFRNDERLLLTQLITERQINDVIEFKIMREGNLIRVRVPLKAYTTLVPMPHHFDKPLYHIHGGLVFTVLSIDLLKAWGSNWWEKAPVNLTGYYYGPDRLNFDQYHEIVLLLQVLPDDINVGYHQESNEVIISVNGQSFKSFKEFVQLLEVQKKNEKFTVLKTSNNGSVILRNQGIDDVTQEIITRNNISARSSEVVDKWLEK